MKPIPLKPSAFICVLLLLAGVIGSGLTPAGAAYAADREAAAGARQAGVGAHSAAGSTVPAGLTLTASGGELEVKPAGRGAGSWAKTNSPVSIDIPAAAKQVPELGADNSPDKEPAPEPEAAEEPSAPAGETQTPGAEPSAETSTAPGVSTEPSASTEPLAWVGLEPAQLRINRAELPFATQVKPGDAAQVSFEAAPGTYCALLRVRGLAVPAKRQAGTAQKTKSGQPLYEDQRVILITNDGTLRVDTDPRSGQCPQAHELEAEFAKTAPRAGVADSSGIERSELTAEPDQVGYAGSLLMDLRSLTPRARVAVRFDGRGLMGWLDPSDPRGGYLAGRSQSFDYELPAPTVQRALQLSFSQPGTHCVAYSIYPEGRDEPQVNAMLTVHAGTDGGAGSEDSSADSADSPSAAQQPAGSAKKQPACAAAGPVPLTGGTAVTADEVRHRVRDNAAGAVGESSAGSGQGTSAGGGGDSGAAAAFPGLVLPDALAVPTVGWVPGLAAVCRPPEAGQLNELNSGRILMTEKPGVLDVTGVERQAASVTITVADSARTPYEPGSIGGTDFAPAGTQVWSTGGASGLNVGWSAFRLDSSLVRSLDLTLESVSGPGEVMIMRRDALGRPESLVKEGQVQSLTPGSIDAPTFMFNAPGVYELKFSTSAQGVGQSAAENQVSLRFQVGKKLPAGLASSPLGQLIGACGTHSLDAQFAADVSAADDTHGLPPQSTEPFASAPSPWWWMLCGVLLGAGLLLTVLAVRVWMKGVQS